MISYANVVQLYADSTYVVSVSNCAYVSSWKCHAFLSFQQNNPKVFNALQIYVILQLNLVKISLQKRLITCKDYTLSMYI